MCSNVAQFLTYMAGRTSKLKLGSMVMVLPPQDRVRLARIEFPRLPADDGRVSQPLRLMRTGNSARAGDGIHRMRR